MSVVAEPRYADELDEMEDFPLRDGLGWRARKEAKHLRTISRGVMLISGEPGGGKDLFGVSFAARQKYLFGRRILLDFLPRRAFGAYTLFDTTVMVDQINRMAKQAGVEGIDGSKDSVEYDEFIQEATTKWALEGEGEVLLKNALVYWSELKRYCYNRNPHNKVNKFIGSINSIWRHLDLLVMGTHVLPHEIDKYTYLSYAKIRATCNWSISRPHTTDVTIARGAFITSDAVYRVEGQPLTLHVDGNEPRSWLGGKRFFDLYKTKNYVNLKPVSTIKGG